MNHDKFPIPTEIPGILVQEPGDITMLRECIANLCHFRSFKFPGSQPVSLQLNNLKLLETENFWVCEKSDGIRVLVMILVFGMDQVVYLIDRNENFYLVQGVPFPHQDGPEFAHSNVVLDAELVIDVDKRTKEHKLRLLLFDMLVCDTENIMEKPLASRYGRLKAWIVDPHHKLLKNNPELAQELPFEVVLKPQELSYGLDKVFKEHLPRLEHGSDGLIFTSSQAPYIIGSNPYILKWKPPSENSIDFLLQLKFPPERDNPHRPDFYAKPKFMLMLNQGNGHTSYYDTMEVDDDLWEEWKRSGEQFDDRIIEVVWDKAEDTWKFMRFRTDKKEGNFKTVVSAIIRSIQDGVEAEDLVKRVPIIKAAWKKREAERKGIAPPVSKIPDTHHSAARPQQPIAHEATQPPPQPIESNPMSYTTDNGETKNDQPLPHLKGILRR